MRRTRIVVMAATAIGAGCYTYRPAGLTDLRPDMEVRALLAPAQAEAIGSEVPLQNRRIEGRVLQNDPGNLLLLVPVSSELRGVRLETLNQRIQLEPGGVLDVELKQLDKVRTGIVVGGLVAGASAITIAALAAGGSSERDNGGPPPTEILVPVLLLKLVW